MSLLSKLPPLGQARQQEMMKAATPLTYADTGSGPLKAHFFAPANYTDNERYPLILFFHGGLWETSMPTQFVPQCLHFSSRGFVSASVETRVESTHGSGPMAALDDVQELFAWLVKHADDISVDLSKVVLAGASGGAWLALQQVLPKRAKDDPDPLINPAALILFSSLLDTTASNVAPRFPDATLAKKRSPLKQVRRKVPPMLLCHGKSDRVMPFDTARRFAKSMKWRKNVCELLEFEKAEHSFFNFNVSEFYYELTLKAADHFLVDQGLLAPDELDYMH